MNRRDFLLPSNLLRTAGEIYGLADSLTGEAAGVAEAETALLRFSRPAMATTFEVLLPFGTAGAAELAQNALDLIDRLEDQMTVYRPESEVSRINQMAGRSPVPVESKLFGLFEIAAALTCATGGAFDISAGALSKAWGFFRRQGQVPEPEALADVLGRVGMHHVVLDGKERTVFFDRAGLELNLGSIGKGYALDRAGSTLQAPALLHGGHSSVLAIGTQPGRRSGWPVGIRHPLHPDERILMLDLADRALGTSAATFQHLEYNGRRLGHILDPRSGWPAEGVLSASATAPTAALADALATAFFILGADGACEYCERHSDIGAVLLLEGDPKPMLFGRACDEVTT